MKGNKKEPSEKEQALLTFVKQTQEGKYCKVSKSSFPIGRVKEQRHDNVYNDTYYYNFK